MKSQRWVPLWVDADSKKCQICVVQMAKNLVHSFYHILYQPKGVPTSSCNFSGSGGILQCIPGKRHWEWDINKNLHDLISWSWINNYLIKNIDIISTNLKYWSIVCWRLVKSILAWISKMTYLSELVTLVHIAAESWDKGLPVAALLINFLFINSTCRAA